MRRRRRHHHRRLTVRIKYLLSIFVFRWIEMENRAKDFVSPQSHVVLVMQLKYGGNPGGEGGLNAMAVTKFIWKCQKLTKTWLVFWCIRKRSIEHKIMLPAPSLKHQWTEPHFNAKAGDSIEFPSNFVGATTKRWFRLNWTKFNRIPRKVVALCENNFQARQLDVLIFDGLNDSTYEITENVQNSQQQDQQKWTSFEGN